MTKLAAILDQIDSGSVLLPEFQRGYVWNRDQVRGLMRSLYRGYPVGGLLTWETHADGALIRGAALASPALRVLILDGQQRITSLYGITRGRPPAFFQGDEKAFSGLRFNVEDETFEFYAPAKMREDSRWIDVTSLFTHGLEHHIGVLNAHPATQPRIVSYMGRLSRLQQVLDRDFHEEKITGEDRTVDEVVEIFNRVNSGGTKLSKGDLALAKKCAHWPEARATMRAHLDRWEKEGYSFNLDWLLRNTTAVATGRAEFSYLDNVLVTDFQESLEASARYISQFLDIAAGRLGLDHNRVLMGRYAIPVICRLLHQSAGHFADFSETDRVLYWYIHTALWGRFAGSTETVLNQDYDTLAKSGIDGLISSLERWRGGNLTIDGQDFEGFGQGSRFYPLLYLLTRVQGARDFGSGLPLHSHLLGHLTSLQIHHIFPKAVLYDAGYGRSQVNAVANFCFLTQETNLKIGKRKPEDYFDEVETRHPGALASQWIPQDRSLWQIDRYSDFLAARRALLAEAANTFLGQLRAGSMPAPAQSFGRRAAVVQDVEDLDARTEQVMALIAELTELGCADPAVDCEVPDPATGEVLAIAEACWPEGLQPGQGDPVLLELDPGEADLPRLKELGYEVFTSIDSLRGYIRRRNREAAGPVTEPLVQEADTWGAHAGRQELESGRVYTRAELRSLFSIQDSTINNGVFPVRDRHEIWLFVTEQKSSDRVPYLDELTGDKLQWQGQTQGRTDALIINHRSDGNDILVFYRKEKYEFPGAGFRFEGHFDYVSHSGSGPTSFVLQRHRSVQTRHSMTAFGPGRVRDVPG